MKGKGLYPGCLAMIVGSTQDPKNNGRVVTVERRAAADELPKEMIRRPHFFPSPSTDFFTAERWWVSVGADEPPLTYTTMHIDGRPYREYKVRARSYRKKYLLPLGGPDMTIDETKEKEQPKEDVF